MASNRLPLFTSDVANGYIQTVNKQFFRGQDKLQPFSAGSRAVALLYNPANSGVNIFIKSNRYTNLSSVGLGTTIFYYAKAFGALKRSTQIGHTNTTGGKNVQSKGQILYGNNVRIQGGVKVMTLATSPNKTTNGAPDGSMLLVPGQSQIIMNYPIINGEAGKMVTSFDWWEVPMTKKKTLSKTMS